MQMLMHRRTDRNKPPGSLYFLLSDQPRVTFLVDENLSPLVAQELRKIISGHTIKHVRELSLCGTKDDVLRRIMQEAGNAVIITADDDFLNPPAGCRVIYLYRRYANDKQDAEMQIRSIRKNDDFIGAFVSIENSGNQAILALPLGMRAPSRRMKTPIGTCRIAITDPVQLGEKYPKLFSKRLRAAGWSPVIPPSMQLDPSKYPQYYERGIPDPIY